MMTDQPALALMPCAVWRRMCLSLVAATCGTVFCGLLLITALDPYGILGTRVAAISALPAETRLMPGSDRLLKARQIMADHANEVVLVGSSRVLIGFDPSDPALNNRPAYNAGLAAARLPEILGVAEALLDRKNPPQALIIGLDFDVTTLAQDYDNAWDKSALSVKGEASGAVLRRYFASFMALRDAVILVAGAGKLRPLLVGTDGRMRFETSDSGISGRAALFERETRAMFDILRDNRIGLEDRLLQRRQQVRAALLRIQSSTVQIDIIIPPMHAWRMEAINQSGVWDLYEAWKRGLTEDIQALSSVRKGRLRLWDFAVSHPVTQEAVPDEPVVQSNASKHLLPQTAMMQDTIWFWESSHMRPALGGQILATLQGGVPIDGFGAEITPPSIENHIYQQRIAHETWRARNPAIIAHIAGIGRGRF
jgi:hypothetical protein